MELSMLLVTFTNLFNKASSNLIPLSIGLLSTFVAFQIVFTLWKKPTSMPFADIFDVLVKYWLFYSFIVNYVELITKVKDTFIFFGMKGAGSTGKPSLNPDVLFDKGYRILEKIWNSFSWNAPSSWGYFIAWIIGIFVIGFLALNIFVMMLEYLALTNLSVVFVPFLIFEKTEFIGAKIFQVIVSQSVRLMVLAFLVELTFGQLSNLVTINDVQDGFITVLGLSGITYLSFKAPELAGGILNGAPSLTWGKAWEDIKSTGRGAKSVGKGTLTAGKVAVKTPGAIKDGAKTGYSKGKTAVSKAANFFKGK
ncbi:type IV secretion system protein [Fusobacterium ulcerans]|uniref:type IV secretion system protein n=1 Tax=Fusobacterium ulcerans TaxID=861 RepID=UPI001D09EECF|nr:type IV secretion system protein [Fusobacterium ulcerans]MCB8564487.1 type IV secretion system protein [Fusobacterium ulcerans]MCB8648658.1 type IV secretion system protein [Fusobacterium ulcerans]